MKKYLLASSLVLLLAACGDDAEQTETETNEEETTEVENESQENQNVNEESETPNDEEHESAHGDDHDHDHDTDLDMQMALKNDVDPSVIDVTLEMEDEPYEADRVRLEIVNAEDESDVVWVDTESIDNGEYRAELTDLEAGTYDVVLHVNGPDDLHEHMQQTFTLQ